MFAFFFYIVRVGLPLIVETVFVLGYVLLGFHAHFREDGVCVVYFSFAVAATAQALLLYLLFRRQFYRLLRRWRFIRGRGHAAPRS